MLDTLTHESFEPHIGSAFAIETEGHSEVLTLVEVTLSKYSGPHRQAFALLFNGSDPVMMMGSQIVPLEHAELGRLDIMISAVGRNDDGTIRYEAVFN